MTTPWIECGRNSVQTWDCDQMGHMNVQFYVQRAEDAVAVLAQHLGLGPAIAREANARLIPIQHHMRFHRELRPGAPYWLRAAPVFLPANQIVIVVELLSTADDSVAYALTGLYQWTDVSSRAVLDMPDEARAAAQSLIQPFPSTALERGVPINAPPRATATLAEAEAMGLIVAYRGEVWPEHCDPSDHLRVRDYMGRVSDAIPNLLMRTSGRDRSAETDKRIGGAALEYRFVYRKPARAGDLISVRSGVKSIGPKTYNWVHWVLNDETGEALATAEAVAVAMDLDARKAIPIPDALRAVLEPLIVPGLSC
jgi:acyl-CoA thioester hydrolase